MSRSTPQVFREALPTGADMRKADADIFALALGATQFWREVFVQSAMRQAESLR